MENYVGAKKNKTNLYKLIWSDFQNVLSGEKCKRVSTANRHRKNAQHRQSLGKCKSDPPGDTTSDPL